MNYHLRDGTQNLEVGAGLDVAKFMDLAEVKNLANSPVRISNNTQLFNTYHKYVSELIRHNLDTLQQI